MDSLRALQAVVEHAVRRVVVVWVQRVRIVQQLGTRFAVVLARCPANHHAGGRGGAFVISASGDWPSRHNQLQRGRTEANFSPLLGAMGRVRVISSRASSTSGAMRGQDCGGSAIGGAGSDSLRESGL